jgi:uncharacterized protein YegP (UPF0339 family)
MGDKMKDRTRFEIYRDSQKNHRWRFVANNNEPIAVSSEGYWNKADCLAAINLVKTNSPNAPIVDLVANAASAR